jgi:hypothetical protein
MTSLHSFKQQGDIMLKTHIISVFFKFYRCFQRYVVSVLYVVKVNRDIAHVSMTIHVCFECKFQMFHMFQMYVPSVLFECCKSRFKCYIYMQVFQLFLYVCCKRFLSGVSSLQWLYTWFFSFFWCFASVLDICYKCFGCFGYMLHMLYLNVAKVD